MAIYLELLEKTKIHGLHDELTVSRRSLIKVKTKV